MTSHFSRITVAAAVSLAAIALPAQAEEQTNRCTYSLVAALPLRLVGMDLAPSVEGTIEGTPATMMIATGTETSYLTPTGVDRRSLKLRTTSRRVDGLASDAPLYHAQLDDFSIGPARAGKGFSLPVIGQLGYRASYDAIIGAQFLLHRDMELSLADKLLSFYQGDDCKDAVFALWKEETVVVPFKRNPYNGLNPYFSVTLNGKEIDAVINSGQQNSLLTLAAAKHVGIRLDDPRVKQQANGVGIGEGSVRTWSAPIETLSIGGETIRGGEIMIVESQDTDKELSLGQDFLRTHRVLFAMSQKKLYMAYLGGQPFHPRIGIEPWMQQEADSGNMDAQFLLARIYSADRDSVAKDTAKAEAWLEKAAVLGHPEASIITGSSLMQAGRYAEAAPRLRTALDQLPAQRYVALLLYLARLRNGDGELGKREFEKLSASYKNNAWPRAIADFYLGRIDAGALLTKAGEGTDPKPRLCEAANYIAAWYSAHGDKEAAGTAMSSNPGCAFPLMSGAPH